MKIEPCPFCGEPGEIIIHSEKRWIKICCSADNSDNNLDDCTVNPETEWCKKESEAIKLWNTRQDKLKIHKHWKYFYLGMITGSSMIITGYAIGFLIGRIF